MGAVAVTIHQRDSFDDNPLRNVVSESIRRSGLTRQEVADRMSLIAGHTISVNSINNWTAPARETSRMPAFLVPAFVQATRCDLLIRFLMGVDLARVLKLGEITARVVPGALDKLSRAKQREQSDQGLLFLE